MRMIERTHETGTFPRDPMIDPYNREIRLRRDCQRTLVNILASVKAKKDEESIRLIEGLLLRSINRTIK